jgi:hypothetical protein
MAILAVSEGGLPACRKRWMGDAHHSLAHHSFVHHSFAHHSFAHHSRKKKRWGKGMRDIGMKRKSLYHG